MKENEQIALFDMDGTLCDYDGAMVRDLKKMLSPDEELKVWVDNEPAYLTERKKFIKNFPGWWRNLPRFQLGFDILKVTNELGFKPNILTKGPRHTPNAWTEKKLWCDEDEYLRHIPDLQVTITEDKGLVYGKILVDDFPAYIERWLEWRTRGLVIMPAHDYNKDFTHPNVIRYTGRNDIPTVNAALKAVKERASGEDWK